MSIFLTAWPLTAFVLLTFRDMEIMHLQAVFICTFSGRFLYVNVVDKKIRDVKVTVILIKIKGRLENCVF